MFKSPWLYLYFSWGVLAFEETPGTWAGKVPMHPPIGPPRLGWLGDPLHGVYGGEWQPCSRGGSGDHAPAPQARTATTASGALGRFLRWHPSRMRCRTRSLSLLWWKGMLKNEALLTTPQSNPKRNFLLSQQCHKFSLMQFSTWTL